MENLSCCCASRGRCSVICISGTHVEIGLKSPRYSRGASGFISNISILLGPPLRNTIIRDLSEASATSEAYEPIGKNKEAAPPLSTDLLLIMLSIPV